MSFCSVGMQQLAPLIVENTLLDRRFRDNHLVRESGIRFFAGYPLFSTDGFGLGSVCILDQRPRTLMTHQLGCIEKARNWVQADLERRRTLLLWNNGAQCTSEQERKTGEQKLALKQYVAAKAWSAMVDATAMPALAGR